MNTYKRSLNNEIYLCIWKTSNTVKPLYKANKGNLKRSPNTGKHE